MEKVETIRQFRANAAFLILPMILSLLVGCGDQSRSDMSSPDSLQGSIAFSLEFKDVSPADFDRSAAEVDVCETFGLDTITAVVTDPSHKQIASGSWPCAAHTGTLSNVPADSGPLVLIVEGLVAGEKRWRGQIANLAIIPSQTVNVGPITLEYIGAQNRPPLADAGPDQTVNEKTMVKLSGLNSTDPDDGIASFEWYQTDGTAVIFSTPDQPETWFLAPEVGICGAKLAFELAVTDYAGGASVDDCIVNVINENQNQPPAADAGEDQALYETTGNTITTVQMDASNSTDPDNNIASYEWRQIDDGGPAVALSDYYAATPAFQAPDVGPQGASMTFEVTVTDSCGLQDTASRIVNITWVNTPPVAVAKVLPGENVVAGKKVTLDGSQSWDKDSDIISFNWRQEQGVPVTLSDSSGKIATFTAPDVNAVTLLKFKLTVADDGPVPLKGTDLCQVSITPGPDTTPPVVTIVKPADDNLAMYLQSRIDLEGTVTDNRNVPDSVEWINSTGGSGTVKTTKENGTAYWSIDKIRLKRGENIITVTATDDAGNQGADSITVNYYGLL